MNFWRIATKVFAVYFLFFVSFISATAQTGSSIYELPAGATIRVRMDNEINSKAAGVNDTFTTTVAAPVKRGETVVLPIGTIIEGRVTKVKRASFGGKSGSLEVLFQTIRLANGEKRAIEAALVYELKVESSPAANVPAILGGAAIGGIAGAAAKGGTGALIGAGIGAGAGTGIAYFRKGKDARIKTDEEFEIKLLKTVVLPVQDF